MNWLLKSLAKSYQNKQISGLTDLGNFVSGIFHSLKPDMIRGHIVFIKDESDAIHPIRALNIRKIKDVIKQKSKKMNAAKANFCGHIFSGEVEKEEPSSILKTRIMSTKEPHTLEKMFVVVPGCHIVHEDK